MLPYLGGVLELARTDYEYSIIDLLGKSLRPLNNNF